jgi:predicted oxidoreductase (fatty acid repression mutant protein)
MKIVKITKIIKSGIKEHFLVLLDEPYSNDDIDYLVEEWCEKEPSSSNNDYTYSWIFIENKKLINDILKDKIKNIEHEIKMLESKKYKIKKYINDYK